MYSLTIPGRPVPKGRPRSRILYRGGTPTIQTYTPAETVRYERLVAQVARRVVRTPLVGELRVSIRLYFKNRVFPDCDNVQKSILDGLQGVAYANDKQIKRIECERFQDKNERAEVEIEELARGGAA